MKNDSEFKPIKITKEEKEDFLIIDAENKASVETVQEALKFFEKRRVELSKKKKTWWDKIYTTYDIDLKKNYSLDLATWVIIEIEPKKKPQ